MIELPRISSATENDNKGSVKSIAASDWVANNKSLGHDMSFGYNLKHKKEVNLARELRKRITKTLLLLPHNESGQQMQVNSNNWQGNTFVDKVHNQKYLKKGIKMIKQ